MLVFGLLECRGKCGRTTKSVLRQLLQKDGGGELVSRAIKRMYQSNNVEDGFKKNVCRDQTKTIETIWTDPSQFDSRRPIKKGRALIILELYSAPIPL